MNAELKAKWIAALRSGEYPQGRGALLTPDGGMCCMAVLREVAYPGNRESEGGRNSKMPAAMARELGVLNIAPILEDMNDGTNRKPKHSFPEIADHIEQNL